MQIKDAVKIVLTESVACRDDDPLLYLKVLHLLGIEYTTPYYMLTLLNYQSVRVSRQEVQAEFPELRGYKYQERHKTGEIIRKKKSQTFMDKLNNLWSWSN